MQRLVLGAGQRYIKEPEDITLDIRPFDGIDIVHDLDITPWPFEDNSFEGISACHLVEHLKSLVSFMNESWRILTPGGSLYLVTPLAGVDPDLEWADPTHKRCYRIHTFVNYFSLEGVDKWGYTDKAWNFFHLNVVNNCIVAHAYPVKK
jgi:predicted SAM-dependent methyltransferase